MKNITTLFAVAALALIACGDNTKLQSDAPPVGSDGSGSGGIPAAPTLGTQIDRLGRPAVNTALNHPFDANAARAGSAKDEYNHNGAMGTWASEYTVQFAMNLAIFDALDTAKCGNGICETNGTYIETLASCPADCPLTGAVNGSDGCGNQAFYDPTAGAAAYGQLATVLTDDELYLETSKSTCAGYLAVEFYTLYAGMPISPTCGGRAPSYDVIDTTYTLAALGVKGFNTQTLAPSFGDTVGAHADISDTTFPFLGAPH
jgi:hypothetical protein